MAKEDGETADDAPSNSGFLKSMFFIIAYEFCERLNYFGISALLSHYLQGILELTIDETTITYNIFLTLSPILCIIGAIVSDNWLGRYHTILYFSLIYASGSVALAVSAMPVTFLSPLVICLLGVFLIAFGSGGIEPCVNVFGADQFKMPEQKEQVTKFFFIYNFVESLGLLVSTIVAPYMSADVYCFGELHCYPLAFSVPAVLMLMAVVLFFVGHPWYITNPHPGNMLVRMARAIGNAVANKWRSNEKRVHWLDHADDKYDKQLITDVKVVISIFVLFIPLAMFWALFNQLSSRWTFQASRMDGEIGRFYIHPELVVLLNPLLSLVLIPLCPYIIYPALSLFGIRRQLQKMVLGGTLAGVSVIISAILEFELQKMDPILPEAQNAQLRIFNGEACDYVITTNINGQEKFILKSFDAYTYRNIDVPNGKFDLIYSISSTDAACPAFTTNPISIPEKTAYTIFLNSKNTDNPIMAFEDNVGKPKGGLPYGRVLVNIKDYPEHGHQLTEFSPGIYKIFVKNKEVLETRLHCGGSYTFIVSEDSDGTYVVKVYTITEANSIHMLWQLPQYIVVTLGEVMLTINSIDFSYSQSPLTMKSVVQAFRLLTNSFGNLILALVGKSRLLKQSYELLLFAFLIFTDMVFFAFMAYRYKTHDPHATKN